MSNTVTLLANQRAAPLPHRVLRRVRHRRCSVYADVRTARLARSERAGWKRVSWRGPYAPLCLECTPASRYLRACTRRWALWSRRRQVHNTMRHPSQSPLRQRPKSPAFSSTSWTEHLPHDLHGPPPPSPARTKPIQKFRILQAIYVLCLCKAQTHVSPELSRTTATSIPAGLPIATAGWIFVCGRGGTDKVATPLTVPPAPPPHQTCPHVRVFYLLRCEMSRQHPSCHWRARTCLCLSYSRLRRDPKHPGTPPFDRSCHTSCEG